MARQLSTASSVGIIYPASDPTLVFGEMKGDAYPHIHWRNMFFLIAGGASDKDAQRDNNGLAVFLREVEEELVVTLLNEDGLRLSHLRAAIRDAAKPFQDYLFEIPRNVFLKANPGYTKGDGRELATIIEVPLPDEMWALLVELQERYGNLSNESDSCIITLEEAVRGRLRLSWMVAYILRDFWASKGIALAEQTPLHEGVLSRRLGMPREHYSLYAPDIPLIGR